MEVDWKSGSVPCVVCTDLLRAESSLPLAVVVGKSATDGTCRRQPSEEVWGMKLVIDDRGNKIKVEQSKQVDNIKHMKYTQN